MGRCWGLKLIGLGIAYWCLFIHLSLFLTPVYAEVFYSQEEALKLAFPHADSVDRKSFVLTGEEVDRIERRSETKVRSKLGAFFIGRTAGKITGFAAIETDTVRTQTQTYMVVLSPEGVVQKTVILAFHEPREYIASDRWLKQFEDRSDPQSLKLGDNIAGVAGSTLTSQSITAGIRRVLATFQLKEFKKLP